jgi:hypothetical protein
VRTGAAVCSKLYAAGGRQRDGWCRNRSAALAPFRAFDRNEIWLQLVLIALTWTQSLLLRCDLARMRAQAPALPPPRVAARLAISGRQVADSKPPRPSVRDVTAAFQPRCASGLAPRATTSRPDPAPHAPPTPRRRHHRLNGTQLRKPRHNSNDPELTQEPGYTPAKFPSAPMPADFLFLLGGCFRRVWRVIRRARARLRRLCAAPPRAGPPPRGRRAGGGRAARR